MAKSVEGIVQEARDLLRKNGRDVITLPWADFYELTDRERIKANFQDNLEEAMRQHGLLICYGDKIVLIGKDFNFGPVSL